MQRLQERLRNNSEPGERDKLRQKDIFQQLWKVLRATHSSPNSAVRAANRVLQHLLLCHVHAVAKLGVNGPEKDSRYTTSAA